MRWLGASYRVSPRSWPDFARIDPTVSVRLAAKNWTESVGPRIPAGRQDRAFDDLDAPVERVSGAEVPAPYARNLEIAAFPSVDQVVAAARRVLYRGEG
jgi:pyruvate/2-oxoglutarate/acetoin dehydrogenase E1 component